MSLIRTQSLSINFHGIKCNLFTVMFCRICFYQRWVCGTIQKDFTSIRLHPWQVYNISGWMDDISPLYKIILTQNDHCYITSHDVVRYDGLLLSVGGNGRSFVLILETGPSADTSQSKLYFARMSTKVGFCRVRNLFTFTNTITSQLNADIS